MKLLKTFSKVFILAALSASAFATNAKASVCYINSSGLPVRGEIVQTQYYPPAPAEALIHATFINSAPIYSQPGQYEEWVPFADFSNCDTGLYFDYFRFGYHRWVIGYDPFLFGFRYQYFDRGRYWGYRPGLELRLGFGFGPRGEFRGPLNEHGYVRSDYHGEGPGAFRGHGPEVRGPVGRPEVRGPEVRGPVGPGRAPEVHTPGPYNPGRAAAPRSAPSAAPRAAPSAGHAGGGRR